MAILMPPQKARALLRKYGIPTPKELLAADARSVSASCKKLGFPLVMKIASPDIIHKTEAKGIIKDIHSVQEALSAYKALLKSAKSYKKDARIDGVLMQEQLSGRELVIGMSRDPQFGPFIMFGLGGIFVEVFKDVSFRIIPIQKRDAEAMIKEVKAYIILQGARGEAPINMNALIKTLLSVSRLAVENPQVSELDLNPVFADEKGVKAADARIILK